MIPQLYVGFESVDVNIDSMWTCGKESCKNSPSVGQPANLNGCEREEKRDFYNLWESCVFATRFYKGASKFQGHLQSVVIH